MKNVIIFTLSCLGMVCCPLSPAQESSPTAAESTDIFAEATNNFAVLMFQALSQTQQGNLVFSPAGAESLLRLLQQGARRTTAEELNELPLGQQGIASAMAPADATALFIAKNITLHPGIKVTGVYQLPFATNPQQAATAINDWVNFHTNGLIPRITDAQDISPNTQIMAVNAIYLKEKWLYPFKKNQTQSNVLFTRADGTVSLVNMMYSQEDYRYAEGEDWKAVALPYNTMARLGAPGYFIGILPKRNAREFARTLTPDKFQGIRRALAQAFEHDTIVRLPRIELEPGTFSLVPALQACGLNNLFTAEADFSGFCDQPIYLSDIVQRCYIKVNEEGTEAAAATAANFLWLSAEPQQPHEINFNRPFIWVIGDLNTNAAPYFMGITEEP